MIKMFKYKCHTDIYKNFEMDKWYIARPNRLGNKIMIRNEKNQWEVYINKTWAKSQVLQDFELIETFYVHDFKVAINYNEETEIGRLFCGYDDDYNWILIASGK